MIFFFLNMRVHFYLNTIDSIENDTQLFARACFILSAMFIAFRHIAYVKADTNRHVLLMKVPTYKTGEESLDFACSTLQFIK